MELYVVLKLIWALVLGILLTGLGVMVGMDMGVGTLLRFVGKTDSERRAALNMIGPHWDGNQVWFVLGGGAIFAAFPTLYATSFSTFYIVMILLLFSMILRPVAFEYRSKVDGTNWRTSWDWAFLLSGALPMFIYGAAMGNVLQGVGFHFDWDGLYHQDESFIWYLLNPFAIFCGLVSLAMSIFQGGAMLMIRGEEPIYGRAKRVASVSGLVAAVLLIIGGVWVRSIKGFVYTAPVNPAMQATPLGGPAVAMQSGAWLNHFHAHPVLWLLPALAVGGMALGALALSLSRPGFGWWLGAIAWVGTIGMTGAAMFPFLMPSSTAPSQGLTIWNACSSKYTLAWMLVFAAIFVPTIVCYTAWAFRVMAGKVTIQAVDSDHSY